MMKLELMKHQYNQQIVGKNGCGLFACATAISNLWDYHISDQELLEMYKETGRVGNGGLPEKNQRQFLDWWNKKHPEMRSTFLKVKLLNKLENIKLGMIGVIHVRRNTARVEDGLDGKIDKVVSGKTQWGHSMCICYQNGNYTLVDNYLWVKPHNELIIPVNIIIDSVNSPKELIGADMYYPIKGKVLPIPN